MKIVIDISKDDFDEAKILFKEGVSNNIEYAVANGKPYVETPLSLDNITDEDIEKFKLILQRATSKGLPLIVERQQGEWEDYSIDFYKCPECGYLLNKDCPHCQTRVILPKGGKE